MLTSVRFINTLPTTANHTSALVLDTGPSAEVQGVQTNVDDKTSLTSAESAVTLPTTASHTLCSTLDLLLRFKQFKQT